MLFQHSIVSGLPRDGDNVGSEDDSSNRASSPQQPPGNAKVVDKSRWRRTLLLNMQFTSNGSGRPEVSVARESADDFAVSKFLTVNKIEMMHMIQEGIRMTLSDQNSVNNRPRVTSHKQVTQDVPIKFSFYEYHPKTFLQLRRMCGVPNEDVISAVCDSDLAGGETHAAGKSGSLFWFSKDRRFVLKSLPRSEASCLVNIASDYRDYLRTQPNSLLVKFLGLFKIIAGRSTVYLILMQNIFGERRMHSTFDLKGTTESRFVERGDVLKDLNFIDKNIILPLATADSLKRQITADSEFLRKLDIMDYSFLLGVRRPSKRECTAVHEQLTVDAALEAAPQAEEVKRSFLQNIKGKLKQVLTRRDEQVMQQKQSDFQRCVGGVPGIDDNNEPCLYFFGIIDILTEYTWKKKAAHFFKKCTIGCCHEIDTEPPVYYQPRFVNYLNDKIINASEQSIATSVCESSAKLIQRYVRKRRQA